MKDDIEWLNFRWGLDVSYTLRENAPLLEQLCKKHKLFWHDGFYFKIQSTVILRWPDWRNHYRVDMEKVRIRKHQSSKQKKLLPLLSVRLTPYRKEPTKEKSE